MAIYKMTIKNFGRARGSRATRLAAYRAGERIRDERTHETYNYSRRDDVVYKEVVLPSRVAENAEFDWARDRAALWNAVERAKARNARLGRELMVVLPPEMTPEQRAQIARRFAQEIADKYCNAVDLAVHLPRNGERNHHAHLLMTTRQVTPEGMGARTVWDLNVLERWAVGVQSDSREEWLSARVRWEELLNEGLREAGLDIRVDRRSLEARGEDREAATPLMTEKLFYMERRGPTKAGNDIRRRHAERVSARLKGPEELARVIQRQKAEARQEIRERERRREGLPKRLAASALTLEEKNRLRREAYQAKKAASRLLQPVSVLARQDSVKRWLRWRNLQGGSPQPERRTPTAGAEKSVQEWLAFSRNATVAPPDEPRPDADIDNVRRKRIRDRDYDYGL